MEELAREFVRQRERVERSGGGLRVPPDLRRMAARFGRWAVERGESLGGAAAQLGVSRATLVRWLEEAPGGEAGELREVVVREEPAGESSAAGGLTLVTPGGLRVEGLSRADLLDLLRSLG